MIRHLCIRWGDWKFENWHLYRWRRHVGARNTAITWNDWDVIL